VASQGMAGEVHNATGFIVGPWPLAAAWVSFSFVTLGTARNACRHLVNYTRPDLQPHVLRIILVGPLYAFSAALCLSMTESACFFIRSVRDIWEAVVIYSFLTLIVEYMGGEHLCLHSIAQREEAVPHLFPFNLCLPPIPTASMIRVPKIGALQFVAVKPVVALLSIIVFAFGGLGNWYYQWSLFIVYNISYSVALYALYLVYWASHEHQALQSKRPLLKFISVKMIVFLTFWQALLLPKAPLPGSSSRWEDLILSVEMVVFSILMNIAFSWTEFNAGLRGTDRCSQGNNQNFSKPDTGDLIDLGDNVATEGKSGGQKNSTFSEALSSSGQVVQNAKLAFSPVDVISDATHNFSRRYQQHVLIESAQEYEQDAGVEAKQLDLLDDLALDQTNGKLKDSSARQTLSLQTFRAKTALIGRSLGLRSEVPANKSGTDLEADGGHANGGTSASSTLPALGGTEAIGGSSSSAGTGAPDAGQNAPATKAGRAFSSEAGSFADAAAPSTSVAPATGELNPFV